MRRLKCVYIYRDGCLFFFCSLFCETPRTLALLDLYVFRFYSSNEKKASVRFTFLLTVWLFLTQTEQQKPTLAMWKRKTQTEQKT